MRVIDVKPKLKGGGGAAAAAAAGVARAAVAAPFPCEISRSILYVRS